MRPILLSFLFLLPLAIAQPILNLQNDTIISGETLIANITLNGSFTKKITQDDITFFESRKKIFVESDLFLFNNTYFIYAYPINKANLTMKITDILYSEKNSNTIKEHSIERNITVLRPTVNFSSLSIKPGLIYSTKNISTLKLSNRGDQDLTIKYSDSTFNLSVGESKELQVNLDEGISKIILESYKTFQVPTIFSQLNPTNGFIKENLDLKYEPFIIELNLTANEEIENIIELFNLGSTNITDIEISSNENLIKKTTLEILEAKSTKNLTLKISTTKTGIIESELNLSYIQDNTKKETNIPIKLFVLPSPINESDFQEIPLTCEELNGKICSSNEVCDGKTGFTKNGYCCFSECKLVEVPASNSSSGWVWGIIIIVVLLGIGYWIYKRSKKISSRKNPEEIIDDSAKSYSKRISGSLERN